MAFDFLSGAQSDMSTQEMCPLSLLRPILTCPAAVSVEIVDGNVKMTLGMIWTIILRFAIQDISVEGRPSALLRAVPRRPRLPCLHHHVFLPDPWGRRSFITSCILGCLPISGVLALS